MPQVSSKDATPSEEAGMVYVYGLAPARCELEHACEPADFSAAKFTEPRLLAQGDLTAIVSDVTLSTELPLDELLQSNCKANELVFHHHRVLQALADVSTVLPTRFGTVFSDDKGVKAALAQNRLALLEAIKRVEGAVEWGIKVFCARDRLGERLAGKVPAIIQLESEVAEAAEGRAFFLRRRLESLVSDEVERAIVRCLNHTTKRLDGVVREFTQYKPQPAEVHGRNVEMILNGACLVDKTCEQELFDLIEDIRSTYAGMGFDHEITGPWPPYSFAERWQNDCAHDT